MDSDRGKNSGRCYLLNTAILTGYGEWRFEGPLPVEQARELLAKGFISAIGHEPAARFLSQALSLSVTTNRISVDLNPGDLAVVLRLKQRLPEGQLLSADEMQELPFELGLLTRLS